MIIATIYNYISWLPIAIREVIRLATWLPDIIEEEYVQSFLSIYAWYQLFTNWLLISIRKIIIWKLPGYLVTRYNRERNMYNPFSV